MKRIFTSTLLLSSLLSATSWWNVPIPSQGQLKTFINKKQLKINEIDTLDGQQAKVVVFKISGSIWHGTWSSNKAIQYIKTLKKLGLKITKSDFDVCWAEHDIIDKQYFQKYSATAKEKRQFKEWGDYCSKIGDEI